VTEPLPELVAHRGSLLRYPENTWLGLEAALKAGACWLEFDIQMCADGRFVLLHDADFNRTAKHPAHRQ
jgi:glycerophosphoryl diester phosphodiesterase